MSAEEIYLALTRKKWQKVRELCMRHKVEGPFVKISRTGDSVLQQALYSGEVTLVLDLLDDAKKLFPNRQVFEDKLKGDVNINGDTILHVAATQDACILAADKIFGYAGHLLFTRNNREEFPIFSATRYGQMEMFKFLNSKIIEMVPDQELRTSLIYKAPFGRKSYTILHVAIFNEHFELALYIARKIKDLIREKDSQQLTALHKLAMNSSAFRHGYCRWLKLLLPSPFRHFSDETLPEGATDYKVKGGGVGSSFTMTIPFWTKFKKEYRRYQAALQLGSFLVKNYTEWIEKLGATAELDSSEDDDSGLASAGTPKNADEESVKPPTPNADEELVKPPTPLILATKFGCTEIALQIIEEHPQTVEQVDKEYGSILHLAIKYRRIEIFEAVVKMKMQMRRLVRLQDKDENSILHMVALNTTKVKAKNGTDDSILQMIALITKKVEDKSVRDATSTKTLTDATSTKTPIAKRPPWDAEELNHESRSPAFILQDDLVLFERVEEILKTHYHKIPNKDLETADQLFAAKKEPLREDAQEWMKRTAENCSLVAILIATVAFAAAYTVPGGTDDKDGYPRLLDQTFFMVFTVADVLSLASTLTAVVVFLSILCSSYRLKDFKVMLPRSLMFGILCLIFSLTMMMLAFAATIILMIKNRQNWTKIALYAVAFLPVSVLVSTVISRIF